MPKYLPIQDSCVRTAVVSINGASQTYRCSEYMREYLALHANREYFQKIGHGVPEYNKGLNESYQEQQDIRYGAARGWIDRMIEPHRTRDELIEALQIASGMPITGEFRTGVLQT